jgi:competence protein ComEC
MISGASRQWKNRALAAFGLTLLLASGCRSKPSPSTTAGSVNGNPPPAAQGQLTYIQIDVGQGDSELIVAPDGHAMLVDAGPPGREKAILSALQQNGVQKLDYLVESHPHSDHIGSMRKVIEQGPPVDIFLASGYQHNSQVQTRLLETVRDKVIHKGKLVKAGDHFTLGNQVTFDVLEPERPLLKGTDSDPNNNSVVLRINHGNVHFLLTGDMEEPERERLLGSSVDFQSDVLKVSHHGSHNGTDLGFVRRVRPQAALISCEVSNDYKHPHGEALDALNQERVTVYRTDLQGNITVRSDGQSISITTEKQAAVPLTLDGKTTAARLGDRTPAPTKSDEGDLVSPETSSSSHPHARKAGSRDSNAPSPTTSEATGPIIANRNSKVYHLQGEGTRLPAPENRVYFQSEDEAKRAGYRPAQPRSR